MNKTTTKKHAVQNEKKDENPNSFKELMLEANPLPNQQIIINILNYSKALSVSKSESIGVISIVRN